MTEPYEYGLTPPEDQFKAAAVATAVMLLMFIGGPITLIWLVWKRDGGQKPPEDFPTTPR